MTRALLIEANKLEDELQYLNGQWDKWNKACGFCSKDIALEKIDGDSGMRVENDPDLIDFNKLKVQVLNTIERKINENNNKFANL